MHHTPSEPQPAATTPDPSAGGSPDVTDVAGHDVVIVGGGAAGLSAALVLGRARRRVVVVEACQTSNAPAANMQGFLGSDGLPPAELLAAGRAEVTGYGVDLIAGSVSTITPDACTPTYGRHGFDVHLADGQVLRARRVLVTTGLTDQIPDIPGLQERWGRDLLHCPYCHGYEVRDQPLGVLGGTPEALVHAHIVRQWSSDVVYFTNGATLTASEREQLVARAIGIVDEPVARLVVQDDRLTGVELASGAVVPRAAVFVRPTFVANDQLLTDLGCATATNGWVSVDATGATSVPGVWAAGNATDPRAQVITAAGEGSAAAIAINNDLVTEDIPIAVANFRLGFPT
jgi:thioredoxin reductase